MSTSSDAISIRNDNLIKKNQKRYGEPNTGQELANNSPLCELCKDIFSHRDTVNILASKEGLQFKRKIPSMITSALEGCPMCRELLCMPYDGSNKHPSYRRRNPGVPEAEWPLAAWRDLTSSPKYLPSFLTPKLHFVIRGNITRQNYITAATQFDQLTFEIATEHSMS
jgi:hypothetical protein